MWGVTSGAESRGVDQLPEDTMYSHSTHSLQAEIAYRQERIRRDYQRPFWFQRKPAKQPTALITPQPCRPVRARHAM